MTLVEGLTITEESVELDGKHFVRCTLINCVLQYAGGEVAFDRTEMKGCRHVFYGRARRTLHYLQGVGLMDHRPGDWGEFSETVN